MGFGEKWCGWIKECISSVSMSVLINGSPSKEFLIERGIRQGDPLSPFLFNIVVEGLNILLERAKDRNIIKGARMYLRVAAAFGVLNLKPSLSLLPGHSSLSLSHLLTFLRSRKPQEKVLFKTQNPTSQLSSPTEILRSRLSNTPSSPPNTTHLTNTPPSRMVSNTSANKAPQKKAAPATEKRGGKVAVAAATVDDAAKRAAKKKADDLAKKAVKKKADDVAKKTAQKKADGVVKKAAVAAKKRAGKPMVAAAPFKAAATVDDMAKKVAAATAKRVGKAVAAAASFKAAATVFYMADGGYTRQIPDQTSTGVHCCHPMSRDIQPAKENMWEKEENTEKPGLVQCKISSVEGKYNRCRRKIPVPPIASNFLGLPIRPGKKDCSYYMLNGVCMYESNCRFNHPDPTPMEGGDAPSVCGNDGSGPSQGAFQPTVVSSSPPRTANETITFGSVVFSPTHKVPPSNVEWDGYQNTTIMETPQPHRSPTTAVVAPLPTTTSSSPPELSTTIDSRLSASPTTADGTPLTSPILVEEDDPKLVKASRYRILCEKMENLCARSCELKAAFEFVNTTMDYMCAEVDKMFLEEGDSIDEGIEQLEVLDPEFLQVNGLKKRVKLRRVGHRLRKKVISKPTRPGQATRA